MADRVVIVGGGITGLAAAHELHVQGREFVLLEAADRLGGKIDGGPVDGADLPFPVDAAADGFLARQPEATQLCREVGLADELVSPSGAQAFIWSDGALRPIPSPSVLGVPVDEDSLTQTGLISPAGVAAYTRAVDAQHPPVEVDASVGAVLRPRVGDEVFERLIDPLLGGINAGNADHLSIDAGAAVLAELARAGGSFRLALDAHVAQAASTAGGPVFNGVRGGTGRLIESLEAELGDRIRLGTAAAALERDGAGWLVRAGADTIAADQVIVTTPGPTSAGLIAPHSPESAAILAGLTYSSAILVTFVIERSHIEHPLDGSGYLVPRGEGLLTTACSWTSSKWAHYDDGTHAILRVSAGRTDDPRWLDMDQQLVVEALAAELRDVIGLRGRPVVRVREWRESLPQYRPGHLERCDQVDALLVEHAPGITVAGAQMRGSGLPACVRQGRAAAGHQPGRG